MKLSLSWILVGLIIVYMIFFSIYGYRVYEEFQSITEPFVTDMSEVSLTTCPPSTNESVTMSSKVPPGSTETYCYDEDVKKCSLSVASSSPESCSHYYTLLLRAKGQVCPKSMPNYYQNLQFANNVDSSTRGCTSGARTRDGKSPANPSDPYCKIYSTQKDELEQLDSCTNVKRLDSAQCFLATAANTKVLQKNAKGSPYVQCTRNQTNIVESKKTYDANASKIAQQQGQIVKQKAAIVKASSQGPVTAGNPTDSYFVKLLQKPSSVTQPAQVPAFLQQFFKQQQAQAQGVSLNISQVVIRDENGKNIAPSAKATSSSSFGGSSPSTAIDGTEEPRAYPNIFHSAGDPNDDLVLLFDRFVKISSITIYNRSDCCRDRMTSYRLQIYGFQYDLTADLVQTFTIFEPELKANMVTENIFTPENVTYTCTELESYKSWIHSIKLLYPDLYATYSGSLDSSETWSDDKKNTFCSILEQTKIQKTMTDSQLKATKVL